MGSSLATVLIVLVVGVGLTAVVIGLILMRAVRKAQVKAPVCGACGYAIAPNPAGLTVCPECGGDFLTVGILAPEMKLGRRASPAVPLGIAWFILVGVGMIPLHTQLLRACTKMMTSGTVQQTLSGDGPFTLLRITASREQIAGEPHPESLQADVALTGPDGKSVDLTIDGKSKTVTRAPASTGLQGAAWDDAAARKLLAAVGSPDAEVPVRERLREEVDDAMTKTAGGATLGGLNMGSWSSSSSSGGLFTPTPRGRTQRLSVSGTSSSFAGSNAPVVVIGPLRGAHWVALVTCATGIVLAFGGLWLIIVLTRRAR